MQRPRPNRSCAKARLCPYCWFCFSARPLLFRVRQLYAEPDLADEQLYGYEHTYTDSNDLRHALCDAHAVLRELVAAFDPFGVYGRVIVSPARRCWRIRQAGLVLVPGSKEISGRLANAQTVAPVKAVCIPRNEAAWVHAVGWACRYPRSYLFGPDDRYVEFAKAIREAAAGLRLVIVAGRFRRV